MKGPFAELITQVANDLGVQLAVIVSGFCGALVSILRHPNPTKSAAQVVSALVVGTLTATYITNLVAVSIFKSIPESAAIGFLIGLTAKATLERLITFVPTILSIIRLNPRK